MTKTAEKIGKKNNKGEDIYIIEESVTVKERGTGKDIERKLPHKLFSKEELQRKKASFQADIAEIDDILSEMN